MLEPDPTARRPLRWCALAVATLILSAHAAQAQGDDDAWMDDLFGDAPPSESSNGPETGDPETADDSGASGDNAAASRDEGGSNAGRPAESAPETVETIPVQPLDEDQDEPPARRTPSRQIEEIVVTATKRESSVRDIPVSIDAMSGDDLTEAGATDLEQILSKSPGVTFSSSGGSEIRQQVVIRGITASGTVGYGGTTTGYLFNDVSLVNPSLAGSIPGIDPYDLATVEVLKGPQGTLFGGAALAGAIRYVPNKPVHEEFSGNLSAGVGNVSDSDGLYREYAGYLNGPVGDSAAVRIVGTRRSYPGAIDDLTADEDDIDSGRNTQARIIGTWDATERLSVELMAYRFEAEADASGATDNPDRRETDSRRTETPGDTWANIYRGEAEYAFDSFSVTGIASFIEKDNESIYDLTSFWGFEQVPGVTVLQLYEGHTEQTTGELRLVSSEPSDTGFWLLDEWDYLIGLYWLDADQIFNNTTLANLTVLIDPLTIPVLDIPSDVSATAGETAIFFDVTRPLGTRFELNIGGRYFRQESTGYLDSSGDTSGVPLTEQGYNPKAAITWHATDNIRVIGSYAKGFRFGGFNNNPLNDPDIEFTYFSDEINNYELGFRSDWLGGALRFDLTGFHIEWIDPQVRQSSQLTSTSYISNAGGARVQGVESALTMLLPANLMVTLNGAYVDARLTESFESSRGTAEEGARLPATPRVTGSLGVMHQAYFGRWMMNSGVNYSYQGDSNNEVVNYEKLPAYGLLGASLNLTRPGEITPTLRISGTNLLNETVAVNAFHGISTTGGSINYGLLRPRTVVVSLGIEF